MSVRSATTTPITHALVVGAGTPVGAYLARLLSATGTEVAAHGPRGVSTGVDGLGDLDWLDDGTAARHDGTLFLVDDGSAAGAALAADLIARRSGQGGQPPLVNIVDRTTLERDAGARARVRELAVLRSETGLNAGSAVLFPHESRLGLADGPLAGVIGHFRRRAAGEALSPLTLDDNGATDWGWTPEYVDPVRRLAMLPRVADVQVASGHAMTLAEAAAHAAEWFGVANDAAPGPAAAGTAAPDLDRLLRLTGWRAATWGRDLVRTLCEAVAAR